MRDDNGKRIDQFFPAADGVPFDMGWGIGVLNGRTVTRTCKGCGVSVASPVDAGGTVEPRPFRHGPGCPMVDRLGNNPGLS